MAYAPTISTCNYDSEATRLSLDCDAAYIWWKVHLVLQLVHARVTDLSLVYAVVCSRSGVVSVTRAKPT